MKGWRRRRQRDAPTVVTTVAPLELSVAVARDSHRDGTLTSAQLEELLRRVIATAHDREPRAVGFAAANLALLMADQGDDRDAEGWYRVAIDGACEEMVAPSQLNLAILLVPQGRVAEAEGLLRAAMASADPDASAKAAFNLGGLLADLGRMEEGERMLQAAVDSGHPDESVGALLTIGIIRARRGDSAGARRAFSEVAASGHPEFAPAAAAHLDHRPA